MEKFEMPVVQVISLENADIVTASECVLECQYED